MRAVVLVVTLALRALETSPDLSTYTHTISDFYCFHFGPDFDGMTDDLVADADGQWYLAPAAIDAVDVGATDTAALDLDVDIMVTELLGFELHYMSTVCP